MFWRDCWRVVEKYYPPQSLSYCLVVLPKRWVDESKLKVIQHPWREKQGAMGQPPRKNTFQRWRSIPRLWIDKKKTPRCEGPVDHLSLLILSSMARDSLSIRSSSRSLRASDNASCLRFSRSASASTPMKKLLRKNGIAPAPIYTPYVEISIWYACTVLGVF